MLRIIRDLCRGRSFTSRLAFVEVARHALARFSSRFVKDWLFDLCLELLYDPVPNVRLTAASILPQLKQCVRLPEDVDLLERLNNAMSAVITDNDRDVSQVGERGGRRAACGSDDAHVREGDGATWRRALAFDPHGVGLFGRKHVVVARS